MHGRRFEQQDGKGPWSRRAPARPAALHERSYEMTTKSYENEGVAERQAQKALTEKVGVSRVRRSRASHLKWTTVEGGLRNARGSATGIAPSPLDAGPVAPKGRATRLVTYGARTTCGSGSRAVASPGGTRAA